MKNRIVCGSNDEKYSLNKSYVEKISKWELITLQGSSWVIFLLLFVVVAAASHEDIHT